MPKPAKLDELLAKVRPEDVEERSNDERRVADESHQYDLARKQAYLENYIKDIKNRDKYARKLFRLTKRWSIALLFILIFQGFGVFDFSPGVLMTLLGTTTANFVGLFYIVANYFFSHKQINP